MFKFIKSYPVASVLFILAFAIGIYTRIVMPQLAYTEFQGDQAINSFVHSKMLDQGFVPYGPISSIGKYLIPGSYYTVLMLFSLGNTVPNFHILANSVCSLLTIPLFGFLIYRAFKIFKNVFLISAFACFCWSIFTVDLFFAGFDWNPNSVTFFWMLLIVIFELIYSRFILTWKANFAWFGQGIILGILLGLHSSSLFIAPIIFIINTAYISFTHKSMRWLYSILGFLLIMFPYLSSELQTSFQNTKQIINIVFTQNTESHTIVQKLDHLLDPIRSIANTIYFSQTNMPGITFSLVLIVIVLGSIFYKGRQFYLWNYILTFGLFVLVSNSYWGALHMHYLVLVWSVPMFFVISLMFSISTNIFKKYIAILLLILGFGFYIQQSLEGISNVYQNKFGTNRLVNLVDMKLALSKLPSQGIVCTPVYGLSLRYINSIDMITPMSIQEKCDDKSTLEFVENYQGYGFNLALKNKYDFTNKNIFYKSEAFTIVNLK